MLELRYLESEGLDVGQGLLALYQKTWTDEPALVFGRCRLAIDSEPHPDFRLAFLAGLG